MKHSSRQESPPWSAVWHAQGTFASDRIHKCFHNHGYSIDIIIKAWMNKRKLWGNSTSSETPDTCILKKKEENSTLTESSPGIEAPPLTWAVSPLTLIFNVSLCLHMGIIDVIDQQFHCSESFWTTCPLAFKGVGLVIRIWHHQREGCPRWIQTVKHYRWGTRHLRIT